MHAKAFLSPTESDTKLLSPKENANPAPKGFYPATAPHDHLKADFNPAPSVAIPHFCSSNGFSRSDYILTYTSVLALAINGGAIQVYLFSYQRRGARRFQVWRFSTAKTPRAMAGIRPA
ncbi:hypothetical protein BDV93DRAFT_562871 [Ceratobasidium sp. AG-I]|nr:hypothetical protein BDV93DRAFT_562871 [Ceratobasidium sp. AG-I]